MEMTSVLRGGWITLNRACNMRCNWCYQQGTQFDPKSTMRPELAERIIDLFIASGAKNVVLIGGEPTIYPGLAEIIHRLVKGGVRPIVATNGRELSDPGYVSELFDVGLRDISVSLKGPDEMGYRIMTGTKGSFARVLSGIENVMASGIKLGVSIVIEEYFVAHIKKYIETMKLIGAPHVNFDMGSPVLMAESVEAPSIPDPFVLAETVEYLHAKLNGVIPSYSFYMTIPLCVLNPDTRDELLAQKKVSISCHVAHGTNAIFTENGDVVPCNHFTSQPYGKFQEDFTTLDEFRSFWNRNDLQEFRAHFNSFPHENCASCQFWTICGGGCKIKWMHFDPKQYIGVPKPERRIHHVSSKHRSTDSDRGR